MFELEGEDEKVREGGEREIGMEKGRRQFEFLNKVLFDRFCKFWKNFVRFKNWKFKKLFFRRISFSLSPPSLSFSSSPSNSNINVALRWKFFFKKNSRFFSIWDISERKHKWKSYKENFTWNNSNNIFRRNLKKGKKLIKNRNGDWKRKRDKIVQTINKEKIKSGQRGWE